MRILSSSSSLSKVLATQLSLLLPFHYKISTAIATTAGGRGITSFLSTTTTIHSGTILSNIHTSSTRNISNCFPTSSSLSLLFANNNNNNKLTIRHNMSSPNNNNKNDEVSAAKEAASTYQLSSNDKAGPLTIFDKLLSGEWPCTKVYEDELSLAFRDINPQAPVHILVIPKHRDGLTQLSNAREDQKNLLGHLLYVAKEVGKKECGKKGFRVVVNDGEYGAQSVYHLHLHVLGGRQMGWPPG